MLVKLLLGYFLTWFKISGIKPITVLGWTNTGPVCTGAQTHGMLECAAAPRREEEERRR